MALNPGYNSAGLNISGQFGMPLYGIQGTTQPFTGNYFWVNPTGGSDGNTGGPQDPFATLTQALLKCTAGNNDVVFLTGTYNPTATVAWNKNNTHLIGLSPQGPGVGTANIQPASLTATSGAFTPLVNVTASGCIFQDIGAISGIAQATTQVTWAEAGGNNSYINCDFSQVGNATAAAQAGTSALTIASAGCYFGNCAIGGDSIVRATNANVTVQFLAGMGSTIFDNCIFAMWSSVAGNTHITAAATTFTGYALLRNCILINDISNTGYVANSAAIVNSGTSGGVIVLNQDTTVLGATAVATTGPVYGSGAVPSATTSNLAIALT